MREKDNLYFRDKYSLPPPKKTIVAFLLLQVT